jgi:hypothetical protein
MGSEPRREVAAPAVVGASLLVEEKRSVELESCIAAHGNEAGDQHGSLPMWKERNEP